MTRHGDGPGRLLERISREWRVVDLGRIEAGTEMIPVPRDGRDDGPHADLVARDRLVTTLARALYDRVYLGRRPASTRGKERVSAARRDPPFEATLVAAAVPRRSREDGWSVLDGGDHGVLLVRHGVRMRVTPDDLVDRSDITPGHEVSVWLPSVRPLTSPGFVAFVGGSGGPSDRRIGRLYANVSAPHAAQLLRAIMEPLESHRLRYACKLLNHPDSYDRPDACVFYTALDDLPEVVRAARSTGVPLRSSVPAFTLRIDAGLAVAQDPAPRSGGPQSFGQHRSRLIADGLLEAYETGGGEPSDRREAIVRRLEAAGVAPSAPWQHDVDLVALLR